MPKSPLMFDAVEPHVETRFVIGIDPSLTGTAIAILNHRGQLVRLARFESVNEGRGVAHRILRYDHVSGMMRDMIASLSPNPVVACIEGYSMGHNSAQHSLLIEMGFTLRKMVASSTHAAIHEVAPSTLKKFATGIGKGDKSAIASALTHRYGVRFDTSDEADAYGLARMALQIAGFEEPDNSKQRESVDTVVNGKSGKKPKRSSRVK